jgi:hypothetical protein
MPKMLNDDHIHSVRTLYFSLMFVKLASNNSSSIVHEEKYTNIKNNVEKKIYKY